MFEREKMGEIIDGHTVRFVRVVEHSCDRVWRAITDETELAHWMGYPVRFEPRVGGRAYLFGEDERIEGNVFIFEPPRTLAYSFADVRNPEHMARAERDWTVRWDLEPVGSGLSHHIRSALARRRAALGPRRRLARIHRTAGRVLRMHPRSAMGRVPKLWLR